MVCRDRELQGAERMNTVENHLNNSEKRGVAEAKHVAKRINKMVGLKGQKILEVGCGLGYLAFEIASNYDAEVVGTDVRDLAEWKNCAHPRLTLKRCDLTTDASWLSDDSFSRVISRAAWEHIRHPYTALRECQRILHPRGKMYLYANLYRSAIGSHLYHEISTPWPHLLYSPESLAAMLNRKELGWAFWLNKLTYAQYIAYFRKLGFYIIHENLKKRTIDEHYYEANKKILGLYPRFDLELDFFEVVLEFDQTEPKEPIPDPVYRIVKQD